jgi:hypothetical protein
MRHHVRPAAHLIIAGSLTGALAGMLAGCASTGPPPPDDNHPTDHIVATLGANDRNTNEPGHMGRTTSNPSTSIHTEDYYTGINTRINAAPPALMDALAGVYADLGIPITTRMTSTGQIGNRSYRVPGHRLKTVQLSQVLDCGQGSLAGRPVDVDAITINVITTIKPGVDSGSVVNTYFSATAASYTGTADPVRCASTRDLEHTINGRLVKAFGGSAIN